MHKDAHDFVAKIVADNAKPRNVLEIGSRYINGTVRHLFEDAYTYVGIDVQPGLCVDVVADGATYKPDFTPDYVVCCEVLEHAANAKDIVRNMRKIVADDGIVIITCATDGRKPHSAVHGGPLEPDEYYANVTEEQIREWTYADDEGTNVKLVVRKDVGDLYVVMA